MRTTLENAVGSRTTEDIGDLNKVGPKCDDRDTLTRENGADGEEMNEGEATAPLAIRRGPRAAPSDKGSLWGCSPFPVTVLLCLKQKK